MSFSGKRMSAVYANFSNVARVYIGSSCVQNLLFDNTLWALGGLGEYSTPNSAYNYEKT